MHAVRCMDCSSVVGGLQPFCVIFYRLHVLFVLMEEFFYAALLFWLWTFLTNSWRSFRVLQTNKRLRGHRVSIAMQRQRGHTFFANIFAKKKHFANCFCLFTWGWKARDTVPLIYVQLRSIKYILYLEFFKYNFWIIYNFTLLKKSVFNMWY